MVQSTDTPRAAAFRLHHQLSELDPGFGRWRTTKSLLGDRRGKIYYCITNPCLAAQLIFFVMSSIVASYLRMESHWTIPISLHGMTFLFLSFFANGTLRGLRKATFPSQYPIVVQYQRLHCVHIVMVSHMTYQPLSIRFCQEIGGQMIEDIAGAANVK